MKALQRIANYLEREYSLNLRSLAYMRVLVGCVLLCDLLVRALSIRAHYTDDGVLPVQVLKDFNWNPHYFSFHALSGELWWQIVLFALNALCIVLLTVGYRTPFASFLCWVMLVSLQNRNPFVLQGGDELLRLLLFWGIFLPWGRFYSWDSRRGLPDREEQFSWAGIGYLLLIASVYFYSAMLKTSDEWRTKGEALYFALSLDQMVFPAGRWLYAYPGLMKLLTHFAWYTELLAPFLLIFPYKNNYTRCLGALLIILLHVGIGSLLYVGMFFLIGISSCLGLLPGKWLKGLVFFPYPKPGKAVLSFRPVTKLEQLFQALMSLFLIFIIALNLSFNTGNMSWWRLMPGDGLMSVIYTLRMEQSWGMFSPSVLKDDGWYIYQGISPDGKQYDLLLEREGISYEKPAQILQQFESDRWRKFAENYVFNNNNHMRPYFCRYLLRQWNRRHPDKLLEMVNVIFMKEVSLSDYKTEPVQKLITCSCLSTDTTRTQP